MDELTHDYGTQRIHLQSTSLPVHSEEINTSQSDDYSTEVAKHYSIFPSRYKTNRNIQEVLTHMKLLAKIGGNDEQYVVSCEPLTLPCPTEGTIVKIIIICLDIPKIFNHINMVLGHLTLSTIEASIMSTTTGLVFDEFISKVDVDYGSRCNKLEADILSLLLSTPTNPLSNVSAKSTAAPISVHKKEMTRNDELERSLRHNERSLTFAPLTSSGIQLVRTIGTGQVCETFEGVLISSNMPVAVKKPLVACHGADSVAKYSQLWKQELTLMELIGQHPNICTFVGSSHVNDSCDSMLLCYEYLSGGCLSDIVLDTSRLINPLKVAYEVSKGMQHLHFLDIMHRDLKSANIILDSRGCAKIADFGLSCQISRGSEMTAETGTYRWMAPEVIRHEQYSLAADVYSFGILLWELFARSRPFDDLTPVQAAYRVALHHLRPAIPGTMPPLVAHLQEQLWHRDAAARPTFDAICVTLNALMLDTSQCKSLPSI